MQQYRYLPFEPIVGNVRKVGETVFMAEILIKPEELSNIVPARFNVISDTAYVIMTEASLRDEKSKNYDFINPVYSQYYQGGILVKVKAGNHIGYSFVKRFADRDWFVMESRFKGFDALPAFIRTTRFPTEMIPYYYIQKDSRLKAVATDGGFRIMSLGFDADTPAENINNFDFIFANLLGYRHVEHFVEERKGQVICDDITHEKITNIRYKDIWKGKDVQLILCDKFIGKFQYELNSAYWFMMGYNNEGIEVL
ncbi:MAG: hypothetical protein GX660_24915 [Clostridiaceae bacterium]|nr:hypothetical protein [Clostridiaceae bacterium]